ncbi:MAG: flagellar cap protein FliD N-terminal domain-containing protein, partial [Planctomycetota bacterium]
MSRITSGIGLVTGIQIEDTVDQLMAVSARPRDLLATRTEGLQNEQLAIDTLSSRVLSLQFATRKLASPSVYQAKTVASSAPEALAASLVTGASPANGSYQFLPVQLASAQQWVSQRFEDADEIGSGGEFSFGFGGFVDAAVSLDQLNGGAGVRRGAIRITDRSGGAADIDLSLAQTVDDVVEAINAHGDVQLIAAVDGDRFTLTDQSGGGGAIAVNEVAGGSTAADLGLAGIDTPDAVASGADVLALHADVRLSSLRDGRGVYFTDDVDEVDDLQVTLADGT